MPEDSEPVAAPDEGPTPATGDDLAEALAFALRFEGRNRVDDVGEFTSAIVAKRLARHLEGRTMCADRKFGSSAARTG